MSYSNDYNDRYNFEEFSDSHSRRKPTQSRQANHSRPNPAHGQRRQVSQAKIKSRERLRERRRKNRMRNRAIIITTAAVIVMIVTLLIVFMCKGCANKKDLSSISTETKAAKSAVMLMPMN